MRFLRRKPAETGHEKTEIVEGTEGDGISAVAPERLACPNCGWHDVRPSAKKGVVDLVFGTFSLRPFRCRACGRRFHSFHRVDGS